MSDYGPYRYANAEHTLIHDMGRERFVPAEPGNRHYRGIVEHGHVILPFGDSDVPPAPDAAPAPEAPVGQSAPAPDADPVSDSGGDAVPAVGVAGTLIDQRKNEISTSIDLRAKDLKDPAQAVIQNTNIAELTNLIIMGLASDEQREQEATYRRVEAFVGQVDAVAAALKLSLTTMTLDQLDMFDVAAYPWPVWSA